MVSENDKITISANEYRVVHVFRQDRVIIDYYELFALADKIGGEWELSGSVTTEEEKPVLEELLRPTNDRSILKVTKDE